MKLSTKIAWVLVVFLIGTNLAVVVSYQSHLAHERKVLQHRIEMPDEQLGRYFRDALDLDEQQIVQFRSFRQNYNRKANGVLSEMQQIRNQMMKALHYARPDRNKLSQLSSDLGEKHKELKELTFDYYTNMQSVLNPDQQEIMIDIFQAMLTSEGYARTPDHAGPRGNQGRGQGQGRGRYHANDSIQ
jgi:Spy/CpxP family protein refolding chaperone